MNLPLRIDLPQGIEDDEFDRCLDTGIHVEQRVEVDRFLRDGDDALAGGGGLREAGNEERCGADGASERRQREARKKDIAAAQGRLP